MLSSDSEEYRLLYTDEYGNDVGLDEVQFLDPPLEARVPALSMLSNSPDMHIAYQAILVLTAWGKDIGIDKLEKLVDSEEISKYGFSPNRITNEDNVYDELAYAVHLYSLSGGKKDRVLNLYKKLLAIYPRYFFESKLKHGLLRNESVELIPFVEVAIRETLAQGKIYQASQLLPVLTKSSPEKGWLAIQQFVSLPGSVPDPAANIAEALKYCPSNSGYSLLQRYVTSDAPGVAEEAVKSLDYLSGLKGPCSI